MQTMMIEPSGMCADYYMVGKEIEIVRVYRNGHVFTDPRIVATAKHVIRGVKAGWMTIGQQKKA